MKSRQQAYPFKYSEGEYRLSASSGLLTAVAAGTASAGHLFAARWAPVGGVIRAKFCVVRRIVVTLKTITGFTAAQEVGFDVSVVRAYSAAHSGGAAIDLTGDNQQKRATYPASAFADMRIATTGALTNGTETFDATPFLRESYSDLAAAATVQPGRVLAAYPPDLEVGAIVLAANEGIVIRNSVAMGAAGTTRLTVDLDWLELESY